jgi:hypothetical protein
VNKVLWLAVAMAAVALPAAAATAPKSWVLVYQGANKWVAEDQNKPLRGVMAAARGGATHFEVRLPAGQRDLNISRLEVLRDLMAREAKGPILLEEVGGDVKKRTIWVGVK